MTPAAGRTTRAAVIYADPPWSFATYSEKGRGRSADNHYACLPLAAIKAMPVAGLAADDAVLFLWATDPMLPQALEVVRAWGFAYKTVGFYWAKTARPPEPCADGKGVIAVGGFPLGTGYYTRANPEMCLLATRGRGLPRRDAGVPKLIVAPRRQHSRKPDEARERIQRLFAGPYLELFARTRWPGWSTAHSLEPDRFPLPEAA